MKPNGRAMPKTRNVLLFALSAIAVLAIGYGATEDESASQEPLARVVSETDDGRAEEAEALIEALPETLGLDNEQAVVSARLAYDSLSDDEKALIPNYPDLVAAEKALAVLKASNARVQSVASRIDALSLEGDTGQAEEARAAYESLSITEKAQIANLDRLEEAEAAAAEKKAAEEKAAKEAAEKKAAEEKAAL